MSEGDPIKENEEGKKWFSNFLNKVGVNLDNLFQLRGQIGPANYEAASAKLTELHDMTHEFSNTGRTPDFDEQAVLRAKYDEIESLIEVKN